MVLRQFQQPERWTRRLLSFPLPAPDRVGADIQIRGKQGSAGPETLPYPQDAGGAQLRGLLGQLGGLEVADSLGMFDRLLHAGEQFGFVELDFFSHGVSF